MAFAACHFDGAVYKTHPSQIHSDKTPLAWTPWWLRQWPSPTSSLYTGLQEALYQHGQDRKTPTASGRRDGWVPTQPLKESGFTRMGMMHHGENGRKVHWMYTHMAKRLSRNCKATPWFHKQILRYCLLVTVWEASSSKKPASYQSRIVLIGTSPRGYTQFSSSEHRTEVLHWRKHSTRCCESRQSAETRLLCPILRWVRNYFAN